MKRKSWLIFCAALLCGTLAGSLAFVYQKNAPKDRVVIQSVPTVDVALAMRDLRVGAVLADSDVYLVKWPRDAMPAGATADVKGLVGRSVIAQIARNEPITPRRVAAAGAGIGLQAMIPSGMRALTFHVAEAPSTFIVPGVHVDIIGSMGSGQTRVIMQNVLILAVGHSIQAPAVAKGAKTYTSNMITVLVTPSEAEELALASQKTTIQFALRNNLDDGQARTSGARLSNLFDEQRPSEPAPKPVVRQAPARAAAPPPVQEKPKAETVDLFNRGKKSVVTIKPGS